MKSLLRCSALLFVLAVSACSDHDNEPPATPTSSIGGVAAVGLPISGGAVALACTGFSGSTTTQANGSWEQEVPTDSLPCAATVTGGTLGAGGVANTLVLHALSVVNGDGGFVANLTPLTDFALGRAVFLATGTDLATWFGSGSEAPTKLADVADALPAGRDLLKTVLDNAGYAYPEGDFDPFFSSIAPGVAGDIYDEFLEAFAQGIAASAGEGLTPAQAYQAALAGFTESDTPAVPAAPGGSGPGPGGDTPDTMLTTTESGVRFETSGTVLDAQETQRLRYWPGTGSISVGTVAGALDEVTLTGTEANSYVNFRSLPDSLGTHDCGYGFSENKANIEVGFAVDNGYNSMGTRGSSGFSSGFRCSITITKVGSRSGSTYTGTIEGHFDAQLYKTGQAVNLPDSISISGHFRAGTPTTTEPETPVTPAGAGILGDYLKNVLAGDYVLKCGGLGVPVQTLAFSIKPDGSSLFRGAPLVDATHPGTIKSDGDRNSLITLTFSPSAGGSDYVVLGFKTDGTFYPSSVYLDGGVLMCATNSGHTAPAASSQAVAAIPGVAGALARTVTLNCVQGSSTAPQTLTIASDGSAQLGSQSFSAANLFTITDGLLFTTNKKGTLSYADTSAGFRSLAIDFDSDLQTTGVLASVGTGPNDGISCTPQ